MKLIKDRQVGEITYWHLLTDKPNEVYNIYYFDKLPIIDGDFVTIISHDRSKFGRVYQEGDRKLFLTIWRQ